MKIFGDFWVVILVFFFPWDILFYLSNHRCLIMIRIKLSLPALGQGTLAPEAQQNPFLGRFWITTGQAPTPQGGVLAEAFQGPPWLVKFTLMNILSQFDEGL